MNTFTDAVREVVAAIPKGKVATYGQVAALAGKPNAARAVGMIMSQNKDTKAVPCHRVVGSGGKLTGYAYGDGTSTKKEILSKEGVQFAGERVKLTESQWQTPSDR
jgi:methylated-DNA-[protein]-cysteine S-methyltransferase